MQGEKDKPTPLVKRLLLDRMTMCSGYFFISLVHLLCFCFVLLTANPIILIDYLIAITNVILYVIAFKNIIAAGKLDYEKEKKQLKISIPLFLFDVVLLIIQAIRFNDPAAYILLLIIFGIETVCISIYRILTLNCVIERTEELLKFAKEMEAFKDL